MRKKVKELIVWATFAIILSNGHNAVFGQKLTALPRANETAKKFVADDGSFEILFPVKPEKYPASAKDSPKNKGLSAYSVTVSPTENYAAGFSDFPVPITDDTERRAVYEVAVNGAAPATEIVVQGVSGVEYKVDDAHSNITFSRRLILVRQRLFQLSVATPKLSSLLPDTRLLWQKKIQSFFDSFVIGKIPPA